jgi:uncharacterized protein (DUF433 family)
MASQTTVDFEPLSVAVPLREDPQGVFRVGKSRVLLELVIRAFQAGATPEAIVQSYDTLKLPDVYAVVSYYLSTPPRSTRTCSSASGRRKQPDTRSKRLSLRAAISGKSYWPGPRRWSKTVLKLATDENFNGDILRGLRRRLPTLDIVRVKTSAWRQHPIRLSWPGPPSKDVSCSHTIAIPCSTLHTSAFALASRCRASSS